MKTGFDSHIDSLEAPEGPRTVPPVSWKNLGTRTWVQLREATYLAEMALSGLAIANPAAADALDSIARILSPDWDGKS